MKFRNQFLKYKMFSNTEGDGGGGGGEPGANETTENNSESDLIDHNTLWDNGVDTTVTPPVVQQVVQAAAPQSADEAFAAHVANIDFGSNPATLMEAMRAGDAEAFGEQLKQMQVGIYKAAMLDANKMMQQTSGTLKKELETNTNTTISSNKLIGEMNAALPFTAEPAYAPMAKAVLTRLLSKPGMTQAKAIKETGEYFTNMANSVSGTMNGNLGNNNHSKGTQQFGNTPQNEEMDWVTFMGGKPT